MEAHGLNAKKRKEMHYMQEACHASSVFPVGELVPHEKPDFLLHSDRGTIGIEVTELCREEPRAEGGRLAKVAGKAQELYTRLANAEPLDVGAAFVPDTENISFQQLTNGLASFVRAHQYDKGCFDWNEYDLPDGYCYIGIHEPLEKTGRWHIAKAFDTTVAPKELLDTCIQEKNQRLWEYRAAAREVWLLIINDQFLGAGEVYARPDHLAEWNFVFDFDKVLLFSREAGGTGEVIELQRA
jgi:hypothetical protein